MEVLILTGACGVGKTSTAKAWAKRHNGAIIECDFFTEWIFQDSFPHWTQTETDFTAKATAALAVEYLKFGLPLAIENVWSPDGIQQVADGIWAALPEASIRAVWLHCELSENERRDGERIPENQMRERVAIVGAELAAYNWPKGMHPMDTTRLTVEEVLDKIAQLTPLAP